MPLSSPNFRSCVVDSAELFYAERSKRVSLLLCGVPLCTFVPSVVKVLLFSAVRVSQQSRVKTEGRRSRVARRESRRAERHLHSLEHLRLLTTRRPPWFSH